MPGFVPGGETSLRRTTRTVWVKEKPVRVAAGGGLPHKRPHGAMSHHQAVKLLSTEMVPVG